MSFIYVNDRAMHLDPEALKAGHVRTVAGFLAQECEDCGEDLTESGVLSRTSIVCDECESVYKIIED